MSIQKFRKKPVVIEAVQWTGENYKEIENFVGDKVSHNSNDTLTIQTLEGDHTTLIGDWVIRGIKGEFYPCKPDIFIATYDEYSPSNNPIRKFVMELSIVQFKGIEQVVAKTINPGNLPLERVIMHMRGQLGFLEERFFKQLENSTLSYETTGDGNDG